MPTLPFSDSSLRRPARRGLEPRFRPIKTRPTAASQPTNGPAARQRLTGSMSPGRNPAACRSRVAVILVYRRCTSLPATDPRSGAISPWRIRRCLIWPMPSSESTHSRSHPKARSCSDTPTTLAKPITNAETTIGTICGPTSAAKDETLKFPFGDGVPYSPADSISRAGLFFSVPGAPSPGPRLLISFLASSR